MLPTIKIGRGRLRAVPAFHGRAHFAELVHQACHRSAAKPGAIAVELGPETAEWLRLWLEELGHAEVPGQPLPLMLGLMRENNRIHPRHKAAALRLQRIHGRPLGELSPDLLHRELGFARQDLLMISPTDSIIEAVRCAIELSIPLYGVDLQHCAGGEREESLAEDPTNIGDDFTAYVGRNSNGQDRCSDSWVDGRREKVMAARLKHLIQAHGEVLFTCGMGHWESLVRELGDKSLPALPVRPDHEAEPHERVLVAPRLAVSLMDLYPEVAPCYENARMAGESLAAGACARELFESKARQALDLAEAGERSMVSGMLHLLRNTSLLQAHPTPPLSAFINMARRMVSKAYARRLVEVFVEEAVPWEDPADWPGLRVIHPEDSEHGGCVCMRDFADSSDPQYLHDRGGIPRETLKPQSPGSKPPGNLQENGIFGPLWVWPPNEYLMTATIAEARRIAKGRGRCPETEAFAGSWHDGIDVRATLRARARGVREVYIKSSRVRSERSLSHDYEEPAVVLFAGPHEIEEDADWHLLMAGQNLDSLVRNMHRYRSVEARHGDRFIASVQMASSLDDVNGYYLWGAASYGNPCADAGQGVEWLERNDYRCCPILASCSISELATYYSKKFRIELPHEEDWHSTLLRCVLPYAREALTVIAPRGYQPTPADRHLAESLGVHIRIARLDRFPERVLQKIRHEPLVHSKDPHGLHFDEEVISRMGEPPDAYAHQLPPRLRQRVQERFEQESS